MRLPKALHEPPQIPRTWWIAGAGVMVILLFVMLAMPWHEVGQRVHDSELPRPRFHTGDWGGVGCMGYEGCAVISVDRRGEAGVPLDRLEEWVREKRAAGLRSFYLRAHRDARWSAVARVLEATARAGQPDIGLQIGPWQYLFLVPVDPEAGAHEVTSLPPRDPEGTLAATREREAAGGHPRAVRLALPDDPDVQSVVHALECYADGAVSVRIVRGP